MRHRKIRKIILSQRRRQPDTEPIQSFQNATLMLSDSRTATNCSCVQTHLALPLTQFIVLPPLRAMHCLESGTAARVLPTTDLKHSEAGTLASHCTRGGSPVLHACCACNGPTCWNHQAGFWAPMMELWCMSPASHHRKASLGRTPTSTALTLTRALMARATPVEKSGKE